MAPNTGVVSEGSKSQSPIMPPQFSSLYSPQNPNSSVGIAMLFPVSHNESRFEAEKQQFVETKTNRQHRTDFLPRLVSRPSFNSSISCNLSHQSIGVRVITRIFWVS